MKPALVWQLHQEEALERALQLQFAEAPKKRDIISSFRQRILDGIARSASHQSHHSAGEFTRKFKIRHSQAPTARSDAEPTRPAEEDWLEIRYKIVDDGETIEVTSVTSPTLPI